MMARRLAPESPSLAAIARRGTSLSQIRDLQGIIRGISGSMWLAYGSECLGSECLDQNPLPQLPDPIGTVVWAPWKTI